MKNGAENKDPRSDHGLIIACYPAKTEVIKGRQGSALLPIQE